MNTFINIFFIFIFMFIILFFKTPNITNNNYILHKIIIFALLFVYQFMLLVMSKVKNKCKIDFLEVFRYSIETAVVGVVGYSIYTDLQYYKFDDTPFLIPDKNITPITPKPPYKIYSIIFFLMTSFHYFD